ncbi:putative Acylphosphatase family protein [Blattamonas nauphoetae]|uniref:acylphosphatase n=1 Tax=Blattamonas nauphoetae TaxID=2049346 RepID=A0ABQ9XKR3_9EUKA|nr:putative Acylphosphatase family protein [Blattamonas nauphoetae]
MTEVTESYQVGGQVQNVMFRQTIIRACQARGLTGGATNVKADKHQVLITLSGPAEKVKEIVDFLKSGKHMNDWGAHATSVSLLENTIPLTSHQVTTDNVDKRKWNPNVKFYL